MLDSAPLGVHTRKVDDGPNTDYIRAFANNLEFVEKNSMFLKKFEN